MPNRILNPSRLTQFGLSVFFLLGALGVGLWADAHAAPGERSPDGVC